MVSKEEYVALKKRQAYLANKVESIGDDEITHLRDIIDHNPIIQKEIDNVTEQLALSLKLMEACERYCIPDDLIDKYESLNDEKERLEDQLVDEETYFRARAKIDFFEEYYKNEEKICDYDIKKVVNYLSFVYK